ncbi:MAG: hypothetical protein QM796_22050 [Chthoniobacteraceae bacterium]
MRKGRISRLPASDDGAVISGAEQDFLFAGPGAGGEVEDAQSTPSTPGGIPGEAERSREIPS